MTSQMWAVVSSLWATAGRFLLKVILQWFSAFLEMSEPFNTSVWPHSFVLIGFPVHVISLCKNLVQIYTKFSVCLLFKLWHPALWSSGNNGIHWIWQTLALLMCTQQNEFLPTPSLHICSCLDMKSHISTALFSSYWKISHTFWY